MENRLNRGRTEVHIELEDDYCEQLELNHRFAASGKKEFLARCEMLWDWFHDAPIEGLKLEESQEES